MSPRTGRPPKCDGGSKNERLEIRLNGKQAKMIDDLAKKYGKTSRTEIIMFALEQLAEQK